MLLHFIKFGIFTVFELYSLELFRFHVISAPLLDKKKSRRGAETARKLTNSSESIDVNVKAKNSRDTKHYEVVHFQ